MGVIDILQITHHMMCSRRPQFDGHQSLFNVTIQIGYERGKKITNLKKNKKKSGIKLRVE